MELRPLAASEAAAWDAFCARSPDAWFWHTSGYQDYLREYAGARPFENASFWVLEGAVRLAAVPALIGDGCLGYATWGALPAPALEPGLSPGKRRDVLEFAIERLKEIAARAGCESFVLRLPPLAPSHLESALPQANPFLRFGGLDIPYQTQVLDLRRDVKELWADVRHGHQADIKKAKKTLVSTIYDAKTLTDAKFREYQDMHFRDAGRMTRSQKTFDQMRDWVRAGHSALIEIAADGSPCAFALLLLYGRGVYYGSSCKDPARAELRSMHLAQWAAVEWLKPRGFLYFDLGPQAFGRQWFANPSNKEINIALFKRGLGGVSVPMHTSEFFLKPDGMRRAVVERANLNLA